MAFARSRLTVDTDSIEHFALQMKAGVFRLALEQAAGRIMGEWMARVTELSPVLEGTLRDSWEVGMPYWEGNRIVIEIWNNAVSDDGAPYPIYVEFGHSQEVGRYVPALGKSLVRAWIPGQGFFRDSRDEVQGKIEQILSEVLQI